MIKTFALLLTTVGLISGCSVLDRLKPKPKPVEPAVQIVAPLEPTVTLPDLGAGQSAASLDGTSEAEKAAAVQAPVAGAREIGKTSVALGSPAEQGFWLKSPLVSAPGKGKVVTEGGASVAVDLLPGTGGSLLSLAAFRALGLGLTDLPEVTVFAE
jgi:hypothetical protein